MRMTLRSKARDRAISKLTDLGLDHTAREVKHKFVRASRKVSGADAKLVKSYLVTNKIRKLQIGCGDHILEGWLNTDFYPTSKQVLHFDATEPFPFEDGTFDFIFSEHMIEHIPYSGALQMLKECNRVLKVGGTVRISTPDLNTLINVYRDPQLEVGREFVTYHCNKHAAPYQDGAFVLNDYFRLWGHLFIYDEQTLRQLMHQAGFHSVVSQEIGKSSEEALRGLENVGRMPDGLLELTTLTLEGSKQPGDI